MLFKSAELKMLLPTTHLHRPEKALFLDVMGKWFFEYIVLNMK